MNRWIAAIPSVISVQRLVSALIGMSLMLIFTIAVVTGAKTPSVNEVLFGVFPVLAAAAIVVVFCLKISVRERFAQALSYAISACAISAGIGALAAILGLWNEGDLLTVLTPSQAFASLASAGIWPLSYGPEAAIRFVPIVCAVAIFLRILRARASMARAVTVSVIAYLLLGLLIHSLTWIGFMLSVTHRSGIESPIDVFRLLVSSQSDGYWVRLQNERFFASMGRQAEVGLAGTRAGILYLFSVITTFGFLTYRSSAAVGLLKRLVSAQSIRLISLGIIGIALASSVPGQHSSVSDGIAMLVFLCSLVLWVVWWRNMRDLEDVAQDEQEHTDRPLPSGAIAPHVLEDVSFLALAFALFGGLLLGWPVCVGFVCASLSVWALSREGLQWRDGVVTNLVGSIGVAVSLGWAGVAFGTRDVLAPNWMLRILLATAVVVGATFAVRQVQLLLESRWMQAVLIISVMMLAFIVAGQSAFWLCALPIIALLLILINKPGKWYRYAARTFDLFLVVVMFVAVFIPFVIRHA